MTAPTAWPAVLAGTPAIAVIEQAIAKQRLSHSLMLQGDNYDTLAAVALAIADRLLNVKGASATFPPDQHPDCFALRPAGKSRQISADATRELIGKIQVSPAVAPRKVAIIHEADRMNTAAANIFLKTLEEPPGKTTLLLLTTRPYALLPTIRSRVLHFRFPSATGAMEVAGWSPWLADYAAWLGRLTEPTPDRKAVADHIFTLYGLVARFQAVLDAGTDELWKAQKEKLPPDLGEDEQTAIETGLANGVRSRLFAEIEQATRNFGLSRLASGDEANRRAWVGAVEKLEHSAGLLRLNLNEAAALEDFLLSSLRLWTRR
jgi:DNA polymerase-3 subunit delta'